MTPNSLLVHGDARRIPLPDGSVDCVVTDPPYGQTNEAYDSDIAFRPDVWRECFRVAKPNAALVSFAGLPTYHRIASAIEAGGWRVRQMWGWVYRDGFAISAWPKEGFDRLVPAMDPMCYATKGKVLLRLRREGRPWHATRGSGAYSKRSNIPTATDAEGHWPRTLAADEMPGWEYFAHSRTNGYRHELVGHPNQKPAALMHWIISKLPGDVICDPFAGSATTGVVATALGRRFVGLDLSRDYLVNQARRRMERPHGPAIRPERSEPMPLFDGAEPC